MPAVAPPKLDFVYFPVRARPEPAYMSLAYGGIPHKVFTCQEFFGVSFQEAKQADILPFGQLPVLRIGGMKCTYLLVALARL